MLGIDGMIISLFYTVKSVSGHTTDGAFMPLADMLDNMLDDIGHGASSAQESYFQDCGVGVGVEVS